MDDARGSHVMDEESWDSDNTQEQRISPFLIGSIILLLVLILVLAGLIVRAVFTPQQGPRSEVERNLLQAQALVRASPQNALAHFDLGVVYSQMGEDTKAEASFRKSSQLGPTLADPHYQLGLLFGKKGNEKTAVKELTKATKLNPKHAQASFELGRIYLDDKKYDKAAPYFQAAIKANSIFADPHYYLGLTYERMGDKTKASKEYKETLKYVPEYQEAQDGLERVSK